MKNRRLDSLGCIRSSLRSSYPTHACYLLPQAPSRLTQKTSNLPDSSSGLSITLPSGARPLVEGRLRLEEYLKELRHERGWSVREAAKRIGVSYSRLQELEAGISRTTGKTTSPSTDLLIKVAKGYEQPLPLLLQMAGLTPVSQDERQEAELLHIFRTLSPRGRNLALSIIRAIEAQDREA